MKSFHEVRGFTKSINIQSLKSQLTFMFIPEPHTIYNEIKKLKPGVLYRIDKNGVKKTDLFSDFLEQKILIYVHILKQKSLIFLEIICLKQ